MSGAFTAADIDRTNFDHMTWMSRVSVFLVTLGPEHQAYLRSERKLNGRAAYPGEVLLPATGAQILAALDETMRRG